MRRRPPFALVLVAIVIPVLIALALTSRGNSPRSAAPTIGDTRPASACVRTEATAKSTAHSVVKAHATVSIPVRVTEQVRSPVAVVSATRAVTVVESASVERPVSITAGEVASARACAHGSSTEAARGVALRRAYKAAATSAGARAKAVARHQVAALLERLTPGALADAKALARAKALANASIERTKLAQQALAAAAARAAG